MVDLEQAEVVATGGLEIRARLADKTLLPHYPTPLATAKNTISCASGPCRNTRPKVDKTLRGMLGKMKRPALHQKHNRPTLNLVTRNRRRPGQHRTDRLCQGLGSRTSHNEPMIKPQHVPDMPTTSVRLCHQKLVEPILRHSLAKLEHHGLQARGLDHNSLADHTGKAELQRLIRAP